MSPSKFVSLKLFIPMVLSFVIPLVILEKLCLSMWYLPHGLVGTWKRVFNLYLYLISRTFECISLELTYLLAK